MNHFESILILFPSAFFAILFLQSGIDKVVDRKGNVEYHTKQFANSPLKNLTLPMLTVLTIMEICCGLLSITGILFFLTSGNPRICFYADCLVSINFLSLFFGLRLSKDYTGAAGLVPYFIASLLAIYFAGIFPHML
jgi:uncharacterized membrane protein YphA (DoxX/SURF4 family)